MPSGGVGHTAPNEGLWFVTDPTSGMKVRTQVWKPYRPDGTTYLVDGLSQVVNACTTAYAPNPVPAQNDHGVNNHCFNIPAFTNMVNFAWNHESAHLAAVQQEAGNHDLYAEWEGIVKTDATAAFSEANQAQFEIHGFIFDASEAVDTGAKTGFTIWSHSASGIWESTVVEVEH